MSVTFDEVNYWRRMKRPVVLPRRRAAAAAVARSPGGSIEPEGAGAPSLARVADAEGLLRTYKWLRAHGGEAAGLDKVSFYLLSTTEIADALRKVATLLREGRYRPEATRSVLIPKTSGGTRELRIATICDRVVAAAVYHEIGPTVDAVLHASSFGFRPGRSVLDLLAALERSMFDRNLFVVASDDVRDAFGSVRIDDALREYAGIIADADLLQLIEIVLRGADRRSVGIEQGSALSPCALNLVLDSCLDRPFSADPGLPLFRWADDVVLAAGSVTEAHHGLQKIVGYLTGSGLELKGKSPPPTNLKRNGKSRDVLGFRISLGEGRLRLRIPDDAWQGLVLALDQAYDKRDHWKVSRGIIDSWLGVYGCALESEEDRALNRIGEIGRQLGLCIGPREALHERIRHSQQYWSRCREQAPVRATDTVMAGRSALASTP